MRYGVFTSEIDIVPIGRGAVGVLSGGPRAERPASYHAGRVQRCARRVRNSAASSFLPRVDLDESIEHPPPFASRTVFELHMGGETPRRCRQISVGRKGAVGDQRVDMGMRMNELAGHGVEMTGRLAPGRLIPTPLVGRIRSLSRHVHYEGHEPSGLLIQTSRTQAGARPSPGRWPRRRRGLRVSHLDQRRRNAGYGFSCCSGWPPARCATCSSSPCGPTSAF